MDAKNRIELAKIRIEKAKKAQTTAEAQKQMAEAQVEETKNKLAALGVTPETVAQEIARLESDINENLAKVEQLIPNV